MDDQRIARAAIAARDLFGPAERRVARHRPPRGIMWIRIRTTQIVVMFENVLDRFRNTVEIGRLIKQSVHRPFSTRTVVAELIEDERIVEVPEVLEGLDQPTNLVVGVFAKAGEDFHQSALKRFFLFRDRVP